MTQQTINIGSGPNTNTGESLYSAFNKANQNFTELYTNSVHSVRGFLATIPSSVTLAEVIDQGFNIVSGNCVAKAGTAPTASYQFTIYLNQVSIGTLTFSAGQTTGLFSFTNTTLATGDLVEITGSASTDATLARVSILIRN